MGRAVVDQGGTSGTREWDLGLRRGLAAVVKLTTVVASDVSLVGGAGDAPRWANTRLNLHLRTAAATARRKAAGEVSERS